MRRVAFETALKAVSVTRCDYIAAYVADLDQVLDVEVIRAAGIRMGVDPMGGAAVAFWEPIAERYGLTIDVHDRVETVSVEIQSFPAEGVRIRDSP